MISLYRKRYKKWRKHKRSVRRSQLISPWGVGAIIAFPGDESLMIAGLDEWNFSESGKGCEKEFKIIEERLQKRLNVNHLRMPPEFIEDGEKNANLQIPAIRFPKWHYCPICGSMTKLTYFTAEIPDCQGLKWPHGRKCWKPQLIPERFITICEDGHVEDFPIVEWVHKEKAFDDSHRLRRSTGGTSTSLTSVRYECICGAKRSMGGAFNKGSLNKIMKCNGARPWLGEEKGKTECKNSLKVVQRGATNVWYPHVMSAIHIPLHSEETDSRLIDIIENYWESIIGFDSEEDFKKKFLNGIATRENVDPGELWNAYLERVSNIDSMDETEYLEMSEVEFRLAEYKALLESKGGDNQDFNSVNKTISEYDSILNHFFKSISLVYKLRETRAFYGFSRFLPDDTKSIGERIEQLRLDNGIRWLPAITVHGEGIFLELNRDQLDNWEKLPAVKNRISILNNWYEKIRTQRNLGIESLNPRFVLLHTFAHMLINQLSNDCGYGSSALRERIYCDSNDEIENMNGILIYTASGDSEGSLGGLVRQGKSGRIENEIILALENTKWCSSDPVCIQSLGQGPDSCNLAACHNCVLLPETSCERGNRLLDRGLLIGTLDNKEIGFFNNF